MNGKNKILLVVGIGLIIIFCFLVTKRQKEVTETVLAPVDTVLTDTVQADSLIQTPPVEKQLVTIRKMILVPRVVKIEPPVPDSLPKDSAKYDFHWYFGGWPPKEAMQVEMKVMPEWGPKRIHQAMYYQAVHADSVLYHGQESVQLTISDEALTELVYYFNGLGASEELEREMYQWLFVWYPSKSGYSWCSRYLATTKDGRILFSHFSQDELKDFSWFIEQIVDHYGYRFVNEYVKPLALAIK